MELCFATRNPNKIREIQQLMPKGITLLSLDDIGCKEELEESQETIEGNSYQKADYVFKNYKVPCFADDTGLEVFALDGIPGVYSARYAGPFATHLENMELLLKDMGEVVDRKAQFRTVITLILPDKIKDFEGKVKGRIIETMQGTEGFGYDPIFQPKGYDKTFAEMNTEEKNMISHRGIAVRKLVDYLSRL